MYRTEGNYRQLQLSAELRTIGLWTITLPLSKQVKAVLISPLKNKLISVYGSLAVGVLLCGGGWELSAQAQQPRQLSEQRIAKLTLAGDRLADQGDYLGAVEKYTRAYQGVVSRIRGQEFVAPVQPSVFTRQELGAEMLKLMEQEYTPAELELMDASFKVLGLIPPDLDAAALMTTLLTEEVAGFYDPDNKRMVLIVEEGATAAPSWLGRLLGARPAFDKDEQKTTLAHELTHALQDQLYDLNAMEAGIEEDDDMLLAFSALVEGDATLLMFVEAGDAQDVTHMDADAMRATFNIMSWMLPLAGGKTFRSAPPIFRDTLTFPYFQGMLFALSLASEEGWKGVHAAYQKPPLSTEQILHPSKYLSEVDLPQQVVLPNYQELVEPAGWQHLGGNCLGELQTASLLKRVFGGQLAAAGWDGDRYEVLRSAAGELALVYVSVWDSPEDAEEFATAYRTYRSQADDVANAAASAIPITIDGSERPPAPKRRGENRLKPILQQIFASNSQREVRVEGDKVWIVEGFDADLTSQILSRLDQCEYSEKEFPLPSSR